jgi:hypothetical protein
VTWRVEVEADELDVKVDAIGLIVELARVMPEHYAGSFLRGQRPEGGAMPLNKKGQPMAVGDGTIATNWVTTSPSGNAELAEFETGPYMEGGYFYAVRRLEELGSSPVSSEGKSAALIDEVVAAAADAAVGL